MRQKSTLLPMLTNYSPLLPEYCSHWSSVPPFDPAFLVLPLSASPWLPLSLSPRSRLACCPYVRGALMGRIFIELSRRTVNAYLFRTNPVGRLQQESAAVRIPNKKTSGGVRIDTAMLETGI